MKSRLYHTTLFAAYQLMLSLGIVTFPIALLCRRAGLNAPFHVPAERIKDRLDSTE